MRTLRLVNLHCNKTDDTTKLDETLLTVDNGKFHGFGPVAMRNKSDWDINANIQFNEKAIIGLFDEDLIRNLSNTKHFRTHIVVENQVSIGAKKVNFATNTANYDLTFEII